MSSKKKKGIATITAVILVLALGLAGTFAASGSGSSDGGFGENVNTSLFLHDDFASEWAGNVIDRDVYVENTGDTALYIRIRLDEFMKYGNKSLISGGKKENLDTWKPHTAAGSDVTECSTGIHDYFTLRMGNDTGVKYKPQTKNSYNPALTDADKTETTSSAKVVRIDEYLAAADKPDPCWILDDDGYAYWYTQLKKAKSTGLILNSIMNTGMIDESYYYGINVKAEAVTEGDLNAWFNGTTPADGDEEVNAASKKAVMLLKNISPKYVKITEDMNIGTKASGYDSDNDGYLTKKEYQEYVSEVSVSNTVNNINFPDPVFKSYVADRIDTDKDDFLSADEIKAVTSLDLSGKGIQDLTGIERLALLTNLNVSGNNLTRLDLSKNTALETVNVSNQTPTVALTYDAAASTYKSGSNLFSAGTTFGESSSVSIDTKDNSVKLSSFVAATTFSCPVTFGKSKASDNLEGTITFQRNKVEVDVKSASAGDVVTIENADDTYGASTKWIVLSKDENEATLITENMVTTRAYHGTIPYPTWPGSEIRNWLNSEGSFAGSGYMETLGTDLVKLLKTETIKTAHGYKNWAQLDTSYDKVYLLTETEEGTGNVGKNVGETNVLSTNQRMCSNTADDGKTAKYWWLRSPGGWNQWGVNMSALVWCKDGVYGADNMYGLYGIRPAVTISLN